MMFVQYHVCLTSILFLGLTRLFPGRPFKLRSLNYIRFVFFCLGCVSFFIGCPEVQAAAPLRCVDKIRMPPGRYSWKQGA